ncbi:MAG TPA: FmdB family zinc ribbon protein [Planctomycetota bacterium]|nr:FmdB family zinc ribbon protein [Planctomycetota bacterium]
MPTYDYECDACAHRFERFQSITSRPVRKCPACGARKVRRLIWSGGAILFKGNGFYTTDYRSESYKKAASAEKSSDASDGKKSDTKSDSSASEKSGKD